MRCASRKYQSKSLLKIYSQSEECTTVYVCAYINRGGGEVDNLCLPVFLKDFVVVVKVKHRIAEIVIDSIFVTRVTEPIPVASVTFPTEQNIYDSSLLFAERRLFKSLMHLVPAQSRSLPQFYGEILLVNYFTKLWREVINGLRKLTVV